MKDRKPEPPAEEGESLWRLAASPLIWSVHFLLCYATAAVWCAKAGALGGSFERVRLAIAVFTAAALAGIAFTGFRGFRRHRFGSEPLSRDFDTPEARHRFLGFATLLLSALSAVAVVFVASAALFFKDCR